MDHPDFPVAVDGSCGHNPCTRDSDTESDDGHHHFERQQRQQQQLPSSPPQTSHRSSLEQRDLLPMQTAPQASATFTGYDMDDNALHTPLPGLQFARSMRLPAAAEGPDHSLMTQNGHSSGSVGGGYENNSCNGLRHLLLSPPRQWLFQSLPEMSASTPASTPPPYPVAQGNGNAANALTGHSRRRTMTPEQRRKARTCVVDGCNKYIVDNHRCFRHGGGKRCLIDDCTSSAKQLGLCWRHGGSVLCKVDGCNRGTKVKGLCWRHRGGKKKNQQVADANARATALPTDSPDPRCIFDGCQSAPVLHSFCDAHAQEAAQPGYIFEL